MKTPENSSSPLNLVIQTEPSDDRVNTPPTTARQHNQDSGFVDQSSQNTPSQPQEPDAEDEVDDDEMNAGNNDDAADDNNYDVRMLTREQSAPIRRWFNQNRLYPYPTQEKLQELAAESNATIPQVSACVFNPSF